MTGLIGSCSLEYDHTYEVGKQTYDPVPTAIDATLLGQRRPDKHHIKYAKNYGQHQFQNLWNQSPFVANDRVFRFAKKDIVIGLS